MALDLSSLRKAVASLERSLRVFNADATAGLDEMTREVIRAGVIQNFEFTYEISHKMLKRYLKMAAPSTASIDAMYFSDLIRTGSEQGLLRNGWDVWRDYRTAHGATSLAYDEEKALEVLAIVPNFLREARHLLAELERRNGATN